MENTYVFLGDSLTFGYGVKPKDNWVNKLKTEMNLSIYNKGINGNTTTDMIFRFQEDVIDLKPDYLFIMGGTNDLLSNRSIESIIANINVMVKEALSNNIKIIIGIPPGIIPEDANRLFMKCSTYDYCQNSLPLLRDKLISICNNYDLKYIDFYTAIINIDNKNNIYSDGIHFTPLGQQVLYNESYNTLSKL